MGPVGNTRLTHNRVPTKGAWAAKRQGKSALAAFHMTSLFFQWRTKRPCSTVSSSATRQSLQLAPPMITTHRRKRERKINKRHRTEERETINYKNTIHSSQRCKCPSFYVSAISCMFYFALTRGLPSTTTTAASSSKHL